MILITILTLGIILLIIISLLYHIILNFFSPPYVPTINKNVRAILKQQVDSSSIKTFYELGCGTAEISFFIKKNFPKMNVIAIEHDYFIYWIVNIKNILAKYKIKIYRQDIKKFNFKNKPCIMYCYLFPEYMDYLYKNNIFNDSKVIALDFGISNINSTKKIQFNKSNFQKRILIYDFIND